MQLKELSTTISYQKEYDILKSHMAEDFQNIIFNIAIEECNLFPRFTIFRSSKYTKKYYTDYNYYMYVGSYSNNCKSYIVLMNICISRENKFISSNKIYITELAKDLYSNRELRFHKYTTAICDTLHIKKYDLIFEQTNLTFDDFLDSDNFESYLLC